MKDMFKNLWYVGAGAIGLLALASLVMYAVTMSFLFAFASIFCMGGAGLCLWKGKAAPDKGATVTTAAPTTGEVNCLKIYAVRRNGQARAEKIVFENVDEKDLLGDRWYFEDIGKWLHVMYNDIDNPDTWLEFDLPDEKYTHPGRLAWVLNQEDYEEFMQIEATLFEKLKPALMIGANALVLFFIFLMSSKGGG